jgi:hypothetical protein
MLDTGCTIKNDKNPKSQALNPKQYQNSNDNNPKHKMEPRRTRRYTKQNQKPENHREKAANKEVRRLIHF